MHTYTWLCSAACVLMATSCTNVSAAAATTPPVRKKVIATGFSSLTPDQLQANIETAEKYFPGNGLVLHLNQKAKLDDGKPFEAFRHSVFAGIPWKRQWFDDAVAKIRATPFKKYTDNFFYMATTGCKYDMFDDKSWATTCANAAILADVAKSAGVKGIFFDIEHYTGNSWPLFQYNPESPHSFAEFQSKARERGRQLMSAIGKAYPNITMMGVLGVYSVTYPALNCQNPDLQYSQHTYGLSKAFFDGMFDAIPPTAKLYDGFESAGYLASDAEDYYKICSDFYRKSPRLCAPEHCAKQYLQSGPAISMYMECYANNEGFWKITSPHMNRVKLFRRNLNNAINATSEYVWVYYDAKAKWFPFDMAPRYEAILKRNGQGKAKLWRDYLPGLEDAITAAQDPLAYAREKIAQGKAELVFKGDFEDGKLNTLTWSSGNRGAFEIDKSNGYNSKASAYLKGVGFGCIHKVLHPKAGDLYYARVKGKDLSGKSNMTLNCQFAPDRENPHRLENADKNGWASAEVVLFVPENIKDLTFSCGVSSSDKQGSNCLFDDFEIYRVD